MTKTKTRHIRGDSTTQREFNRVFPDEGNQTVIATYICAYHTGSFLAQGKLYLSPSSICFYASFPTREKFAIKLVDVKKITKKKTAVIFSNAIELVDTDERKYFLSGFIYRDSAYKIMKQNWEIAREVEAVLLEDERLKAESESSKDSYSNDVIFEEYSEEESSTYEDSTVNYINDITPKIIVEDINELDPSSDTSIDPIEDSNDLPMGEICDCFTSQKNMPVVYEDTLEKMTVNEFYNVYLRHAETFVDQFAPQLGYQDPIATPWEVSECHSSRLVEYTIKLSMTLGSNHTPVIQKQLVKMLDKEYAIT
eukprot:TRINITY_DN8822_c0_g1_i2.p1 TRINITY_DN8822_c0_g1~~TRINITY_DN8822_c0_g1_i2.p1  ORF type:complete len:310 (-),score=79.61 TRINITY_DN8822_c0_g1_i2:30-959(-)